MNSVQSAKVISLDAWRKTRVNLPNAVRKPEKREYVQLWWNPTERGESISGIIAELAQVQNNFGQRGERITLCRVKTDDGIQAGFTIGEAKWVDLFRKWQQVGPKVGDRIVVTFRGKNGRSPSSKKLFQLTKPGLIDGKEAYRAVDSRRGKNA